MINKRIQDYNDWYGFLERPNHFSFNFDPQRVLLRNDAIHSNNTERYERYMSTYYPEKLSVELEDIQEVTEHLIRLDKLAAQEWFHKNQINLVESDVYIFDELAILSPFKVQEEQLDLFILDGLDEMIYNLMKPIDLLGMKCIFYIDSRIKR